MISRRHLLSLVTAALGEPGRIETPGGFLWVALVSSREEAHEILRKLKCEKSLRASADGSWPDAVQPKASRAGQIPSSALSPDILRKMMGIEPIEIASVL